MGVKHEPARARLATRLAAWIVLFAAIIAALQVSSLAGLFLLAKIKHIAYAPVSESISPAQRRMLENLLAGRTVWFVHSPDLGWTIKRNGHAPLYRANSEGIRADREFGRAPIDGVLRIAAFGDSFMYGADVDNKDTWEEMLMRAHRNVEVLNFGVGGYGTDQAFLRYQREGRAYKPDVVLIGFFSDNIYRNVNVYRPFYTGNTDIPLAKPRFVLRNGALVLLPNPLPMLGQYRDLLADPVRALSQLGQHDYFFQSRYHAGGFAFLPSVRLYQIVRSRVVTRGTEIDQNGHYDVNSEAFKVTAAIIDQFVEAVQQAGSVPVIVAMPSAWDIETDRIHGEKMYAPLLEHFQTRGYRYVDLLEGFQHYGGSMAVGQLAPGHYSPAGNELVAKALWEYLAKNRLVDPKALRSH